MSSCPTCGKPATGKFCSHCGSAVNSGACSACGAALGGNDRFCHKCGAPAGRPQQVQSRLPWIVAGAAVVILILVVIVRFTGSQPPAPQASGPAQAPAGGGMVDLNQMSPREAADRLFDRIMSAHEQGNESQVSFFLPMAIQSYQMLGQKDADAHYHLGLIHTVAGQADAALLQADSLELVAPNHLFVSMLKAAVSQSTGDSATLEQAYRDFTQRYDAEIATGKPEYGAHQNAIESFRAEASGAVGG